MGVVGVGAVRAVRRGRGRRRVWQHDEGNRLVRGTRGVGLGVWVADGARAAAAAAGPAFAF
jgi:hypothetical protein